MIFIIIFLTAIVITFGVLSYRIWQLQNVGEKNSPVAQMAENPAHAITFKKLEKDALNFLKYSIQKIVLIVAKYWFLLTTKIKKFLMEKWPKIYNFFVKKESSIASTQQPSFFARALLESKYKIKRLKKKIREDHDMPE